MRTTAWLIRMRPVGPLAPYLMSWGPSERTWTDKQDEAIRWAHAADASRWIGLLGMIDECDPCEEIVPC